MADPLEARVSALEREVEALKRVLERRLPELVVHEIEQHLKSDVEQIETRIGRRFQAVAREEEERDRHA